MIDNRAYPNTSKTITKVVTFYSDGTFTEYTPSPYIPQNPYTVPYPQPAPYNPFWYQIYCNHGTNQAGGGVSVNETKPKEPGPYGAT